MNLRAQVLYSSPLPPPNGGGWLILPPPSILGPRGLTGLSGPVSGPPVPPCAATPGPTGAAGARSPKPRCGSSSNSGLSTTSRRERKLYPCPAVLTLARAAALT